MLTASAIAAQERTQEEVQNQESEDSEDEDFTAEEKQQDDLERDIAEGESIEEQETMEETFKRLTIKTPKKTLKNNHWIQRGWATSVLPFYNLQV